MKKGIYILSILVLSGCIKIDQKEITMEIPNLSKPNIETKKLVDEKK